MKSNVHKSLIFVSTILFVSMLVYSCDSPTDSYKQFAGKEEINYSQKIDTVVAKAGINSVLLKVPTPVNPTVVKAGVFWNLGSDSSKVDFDPDQDTLRINIDSLNVTGPTQTYSFKIYTYNETGNRSVGLNRSVDIYGKDAAPGKFTDIKVENKLGGAKISYKLSKTNNLAYVKVVYHTKANGKEMAKKNTDRTNNSITLTGFDDANLHNIKLYAISTAEFQSKPDTVTIHPFLLFDQTNWKVLSVDSQQSNSAFVASNILDGDSTTIWASQYNPILPLPHYASINMGKNHKIYGFKIVGHPAQYQNQNPKHITIKFSNNGRDYKNGEDFTLSLNNNQTTQTTIYLSDAVEAQYFKLIIKDNVTTTQITSIGEIYALGN